jgi:hypothetical protein
MYACMYMHVCMYICMHIYIHTHTHKGTLSYPTVLLFKSSKILVVMVTGIIILNKRFAAAEYGAAMLSVDISIYMYIYINIYIYI